MVKMYCMYWLDYLSLTVTQTHTHFILSLQWQSAGRSETITRPQILALPQEFLNQRCTDPMNTHRVICPAHTHTHNSTGQECADKKPRPFTLSFSFILSLTELWWCLLKNLKTLQPFLIIKCWQFGIKILNRTKPSILKNECWIFML